jgi:O-antigen ligase
VLFSYFLILAFPLVSGQNSWTGCREDKCTALGNLFTSFFQSENALALYVLTTMYFVTFLRNKKLVALGFVLSPLLCYLSGSRIGFASALLVALIFLLKKGQVLIWGPAIFSIGSLFLFATGTGSDLTGRGNIFESVRQIWLSSPIFGVGPGATQSAFQKGLVVGFVPFNEQTEIAHVLAEFGLIVCLVFVCLLFLVTTKGRKFDKDGIQAATITPFLIASLAFITEVTVSFSIESTSFWISALLFAKVQSDLGQEFPSSLKAIN